ncbi:MAG: class I SAM-dependent methyltransferase [Gemmatimonadaceae bacterium]
MHSVHRLAGDPELRAPSTFEPPASLYARALSPGADLAHARRIARLAFGPAADRDFTVRYWDAATEPAGHTPARFTIHLRHPSALRAMFWPPAELRVAEAFVSGAYDVDGDLEAATALASTLRDRLCRPRTLVRLLYHVLALPAPSTARVGPRLERHAHHAHQHSLTRDGAAVRSHYDVGNDFYTLWLDRGLVYSCAYFTSDDATLDDAQRAKLDHLCRKLRLQPGERLLDVGCGWGALVRHAAEHYGVRATGVTLSPAQAELATARVREAGLSDRVDIQVRDYRTLAPDEPFDKIVSVGMFEHVGRQQMPVYFAAMHRLLRPGGLFMNHGIIEAPTRRPHGWRASLRGYVWRQGSFIDRDVFPDGDLVQLATEVGIAEQAGFEVRDVESLRPHYARTLRAWVQRLESHWDEAVGITSDATARTWRLYMAASAHAFASGQIGLAQVLFGKPDLTGHVGLPPTRRDLYVDP